MMENQERLQNNNEIVLKKMTQERGAWWRGWGRWAHLEAVPIIQALGSREGETGAEVET